MLTVFVRGDKEGNEDEGQWTKERGRKEGAVRKGEVGRKGLCHGGPCEGGPSSASHVSCWMKGTLARCVVANKCSWEGARGTP